MKKAITFVSIVTALLSSFSAYPASIVVNSTGDAATSGDTFCTLREAINNANSDSDTTSGDCTAGSGTDTITFSNDFAITLSTSLPQIATTIIIDSASHSTTVDGNSSNRGFIVGVNGDLTIDLLTIVDGNGGTAGGGISNAGSLTVSNSTISNCIAGSGGGIYNESTGTLKITNSTISSNTATNSGGGIYTDGIITSITNSTISGNSANTGAGIYNHIGEIISIANSTFSGNSATTLGGGIFNNNMINTIANSTFARNSGNFPTSGGDESGGGIYNNIGASISTLVNTIIMLNAGSNCSGPPPSTSYNNVADFYSCRNWGTEDETRWFGQEQLGPLASNGGPTQTMALLLSIYYSTNPAIDAGDATTCSSPPVNGLDQRGVSRPQFRGCDIGAFEQTSRDIEIEAQKKFPWELFIPKNKNN